MLKITTKKRNNAVDVIRGIAILMVVLGHTITGSVTDFENSLIYNIIWSLQMPLFFTISGYITKFSHEIDTVKDLGSFFKKRTLSYIGPWVIWTFFIRGFILGQKSFLNIKNLLYHMDSGYWFLFSLWTITMVFGISQWMSKKICKSPHKIKSVIFTIGFYIIGTILLAGVAIIFGTSFLCLKLTLYYIPFFLIGYLYGKTQDKIYSIKYGNSIVDAVVAISFIIYTIFIMKINIVSLSENLYGIVFRASVSFFGCISISGIITKLIDNGKISQFFAYVGTHSLEIYLVHYLLLSLLKIEPVPNITSISGTALVIANFIITVSLSLLFTKISNNNKWLKLILFTKK